jgi:hypothetical protein
MRCRLGICFAHCFATAAAAADDDDDDDDDWLSIQYARWSFAAVCLLLVCRLPISK